MQKWIIAGLAVLVVLSVAFAGFNYFSHKQAATVSAKLISINTATQTELEALPGIGPVLSERIIEGRPYNEILEILKIKGIGPKKLAKIKGLITVN